MGEPIAEVGGKAGLCGYDGSSWQKLPLLLGYQNTINGSYSQATGGGGQITLNGATVPANEIWIIQSAVAYASGATTTVASINIVQSGVQYVIDLLPTPAAYTPVKTINPIILSAGDNLRAVFTNLPASQTLYLHYTGYKMAIS